MVAWLNSALQKCLTDKPRGSKLVLTGNINTMGMREGWNRHGEQRDSHTWGENRYVVLEKRHVGSFSFWCINGCFHAEDTPS